MFNSQFSSDYEQDSPTSDENWELNIDEFPVACLFYRRNAEVTLIDSFSSQPVN